MTKIEVSVLVERPPEAVFAFITNFENNPLWQSGVQSATITSDGPMATGSTYTQTSKFLGKHIEFSFEVTDYQPNKMIAFKTVSGTFPVQIVRAVEPVENGTRVSAIIEGEAGGVFKLAKPLLDRMTQRQIEKDYAALKAYLEAGHADS